MQEYAQNNPELAYAVNEDEENDTENDIIGDVEGDVTAIIDESVSDNTEQSDDSATAIDKFISPDRIVYQENFYYEPLNEELKLYITGNSYPAGTLNSVKNENEELIVSENVLPVEDTDTENTNIEIIYDDLSYVHVMHYNFDGEVTEGELICNNAIAEDLVEIFYELYKAEYQIEKIRLIDEYGADDNLSMEDNHTSCFNYRVVDGSTKLSNMPTALQLILIPFITHMYATMTTAAYTLTLLVASPTQTAVSLSHTKLMRMTCALSYSRNMDLPGAVTGIP